MPRKTIIRLAAGIGLVIALAAGPAEAADLLSGQWEGAYSCNQGMTALSLSIEPDGEQWTGRFTFGPVKGNKSVPHGAYELTIRQDGGRYHMEPGAWIERPDSYVTVALDGTMSQDSLTLSGIVLFEGCQNFQVSRTSPLPAAPALKDKGSH